MSTPPPPTDTVGAPQPGAVPPHSIEAEQAVLGAILQSDRTHYAYIIEEALREGDFYRERHRTIFESVLALFAASEPIDVLTLTEHLRSRGKLEEAGGQAEIDALTAAAPSVGALRHYGRLVKDRSLLRRLLSATYDIQASVHGHDGEPRDLIERAERTILEVAHDDRQKDFRKVGDVLHTEIGKWQKLSTEGQQLTGTASGFADLDAITGGFQPGNLIILAARPSMGKSALMANFCENAALTSNKAVALFSLEMSEGELAQRFIASQASIKGDDLRKGRVPQARWSKILAASARLSESKLFIDDSSDLSVLDVRAKARRLLQQNPDGLGLIVIDYLQLMSAGGGGPENRVEQIGMISRGLKTLARELEVPVIALSQLNRGVEQRKPPTPMLSDLRESGAIEQDADLVMFIYREDYYDKESEREGIADLIIAKHRNGGLGTVELTFQRDFPRFMSYAGDDRY